MLTNFPTIEISALPVRGGAELVLLLGLHSPVLEPDLDLSLTQPCKQTVIARCITREKTFGLFVNMKNTTAISFKFKKGGGGGG